MQSDVLPANTLTRWENLGTSRRGSAITPLASTEQMAYGDQIEGKPWGFGRLKQVPLQKQRLLFML